MTLASRVVYTAIAGGHAQLSARPRCPDTDFVCFTDRPIDRPDWDVRSIEAPTDLSPRMRAKYHKVFPPAGYAWSVWVDGSFVLDCRASPSRLVDDLVRASPGGLGMHRHPRIDCIYAEGEDVLSHPLLHAKRRGQPIAAQLECYRREGHPERWGLWACGAICRIGGSSVVDRVMRDWWSEMLRWSDRDQVSLPVVLRRLGVRPDDWPWPLYGNPHFPEIRHNWLA